MAKLKTVTVCVCVCACVCVRGCEYLCGSQAVRDGTLQRDLDVPNMTLVFCDLEITLTERDLEASCDLETRCVVTLTDV